MPFQWIWVFVLRVMAHKTISTVFVFMELYLQVFFLTFFILLKENVFQKFILGKPEKALYKKKSFILDKEQNPCHLRLIWSTKIWRFVFDENVLFFLSFIVTWMTCCMSHAYPVTKQTVHLHKYTQYKVRCLKDFLYILLLFEKCKSDTASYIYCEIKLRTLENSYVKM